MNRFKKSRSRSILQKFLYVLIFCGILCIFLSGLSWFPDSIPQRRGKSEEIHSAKCCALLCHSGFYPDSMDYLEKYYGISYDKEKYLVSYEAFGSNMMPDITVFSNNSKKGEN